MSIIQTIFEFINSFLKKKGESFLFQKYNESKEKKKVLETFGKAIKDNIQRQTGNNEAGMVDAFLQRSDVYTLLKSTMVIYERNEAIKRLIISFKNHSRSAFNHDFNYDECINVAVNEVLRLHGNEQQRNFVAISDQIEKNKTPSSVKEKLDSKKLLMTFSVEKDKVFPEECFLDYDSAIPQVKLLWDNNHMIQIIGPRGSGKKQIIAHMPFFNNTIFIRSSHITTTESLVRELSARCLNDQSISPDGISHFFALHKEYTIALTDLEKIDRDLFDYLVLLPCKIIVTSSNNLLSDIPVYYHNLPSLEQGMQIYSNYYSNKNGSTVQDIEIIQKMIEESGRIPECIKYIALYQLYVDEKISISEFESRIHSKRKEGETIVAPSEYMKTILFPQFNIPSKMKEVLRTISILPDNLISRRFLQYIIDYFEGGFTYQDLISKGFGSMKTIEDTDVFIGSALINESIEEDEEFYVHLGTLIWQYVNSFSSLNDYTLMEIYEACNICEFFYTMMYEKIPAPTWCMFLTKKAEIYEFLGLHQICINECYRILSIEDLQSVPHLVVKIKVTLSRALVKYGLHGQANEVIRSIPINLTDEEDKIQIEETLERIDFENKQFDTLILDIKTNISENPYERIEQFHQLATMNYYMQNLEEAKEYYELAESLIEELHYENTIIASMIYAAGSAIFLDIDNSSKAIELAKKSIEIASHHNKKTNSHILTAYNNLGNAYLVSNQFLLAIQSYEYVMNNYDEILSSSSPMIINARINMEICHIMANNTYNAKSFEHMMVYLATDKDNYHLAILSIISVATIAAEQCELKRLKRILDVSEKWIRDYTDYPEKDLCCLLLNRLIFAESIATSFCSKIKNRSQRTKQYKNYWHFIKQGMFDNDDEHPCPPTQSKKDIPVYSDYSNEKSTNNKEQKPLYWVLSSFPPKDAYMGYIMPDDSMNPDIQKGDILWVKKQKKPIVGDVVLYCTKDRKKWLCMKIVQISDQKVLVPNNKKYKSIVLGNQEQEHFCGIIIFDQTE